jgi:hypothetical protein
MTPEVLLALCEGRAYLEEKKKEPPYVVFLPPMRMLRLIRELEAMGVHFGVPFTEAVPEPKEDSGEWIYFGVLLGDLHVYGRAR